MDMIGMMLRGAGIDPEAIMTQAKGLGEAFAQLQAGQKAALDRLETLQAGQDAIMAAMGLSIAPPTGAVAELIALESRRLIDQHGGPAETALAS